MTDATSFDPDREPGRDPTEARLQRSTKTHATDALSPLEIAQAAAQLASEKKAEDILLLEVSGICSYADYFVLSSAPSERQVMAIARSVDDGLRRGGIKPINVEGMRQGTWVLIDTGEVVVHTFQTGAREYYDLEGFWADAERVEFDEKAGIEALRRIGLNRFGEPLASSDS